MKNLQIKLGLLLVIGLALPHLSIAQDHLDFELKYEVNRVYQPSSITKTQLNEAKTLMDLDDFYKSSWVKEYIEVEIMASHNGKVSKAVSKNDVLTPEQKDIMKVADVGTEILVKMQYIPDNTLKHNDMKVYDFTFRVDPAFEATYVGGQQELNQYLKDNVRDKISKTSFEENNLTAVQFTIDEEGKVIDAHLYDTSIYKIPADQKVDELLLNAICNMPNWKPAAYANGMKVKQEFVLTVGDHNSCIVNLLNICRDCD